MLVKYKADIILISDQAKKRSDLPLTITPQMKLKKRSDLPLTIIPQMKLKEGQVSGRSDIFFTSSAV
jgi:hypothetical protein